jgi:hypothetical protein
VAYFIAVSLHSLESSKERQTGSEAHPATYPMGSGGSSPGVKRLGSEAPSNDEVKNA